MCVYEPFFFFCGILVEHKHKHKRKRGDEEEEEEPLCKKRKTDPSPSLVPLWHSAEWHNPVEKKESDDKTRKRIDVRVSREHFIDDYDYQVIELPQFHWTGKMIHDGANDEEEEKKIPRILWQFDSKEKDDKKIDGETVYIYRLSIQFRLRRFERCHPPFLLQVHRKTTEELIHRFPVLYDVDDFPYVSSELIVRPLASFWISNHWRPFIGNGVPLSNRLLQKVQEIKTQTGLDVMWLQIPAANNHYTTCETSYTYKNNPSTENIEVTSDFLLQGKQDIEIDLNADQDVMLNQVLRQFSFVHSSDPKSWIRYLYLDRRTHWLDFKSEYMVEDNWIEDNWKNTFSFRKTRPLRSPYTMADCPIFFRFQTIHLRMPKYRATIPCENFYHYEPERQLILELVNHIPDLLHLIFDYWNPSMMFRSGVCFCQEDRHRPCQCATIPQRIHVFRRNHTAYVFSHRGLTLWDICFRDTLFYYDCEDYGLFRPVSLTIRSSPTTQFEFRDIFLSDTIALLEFKLDLVFANCYYNGDRLDNCYPLCYYGIGEGAILDVDIKERTR
jgi:hypothetical protein